MLLSSQGETCSLNSEMPKTFHACPSINKSTEHIFEYVITVRRCFQPLQDHCKPLQLAVKPEPAIRATGMRRKLRSTLFGSEMLERYILLLAHSFPRPNPTQLPSKMRPHSSQLQPVNHVMQRILTHTCKGGQTALNLKYWGDATEQKC